MKTVFGWGLGVMVAALVAGCGGGVDAVEDGGEGGGGGDDGAPTSAAGDTTGAGSPTVGSSTTTTTGGGAGGPGAGGGPPATDCAPSGDDREVVACAFPPDIAVLGADDDFVWILALGSSTTARTFRIDLATGERIQLDHDDFSGSGLLQRASNYAVQDGAAYAVLNHVTDQSVDTGVFRLEPSGRVPLVSFGASTYTRLVGAGGVLFYEGGQGLNGLWSVPGAGGPATQWIDFGCDSCGLSGGLIGAAEDPEIGVTALYGAGGEVFRLPDTETPVGVLDDAVAREATVDPTSGALLVPYDDGLLGTHRVDRIELDGTITPLIDVPDVEGYGPPRFLRTRVDGGRVELIFLQTPDEYGKVWRIDATTGEDLGTGPSPIWTRGQAIAHGSWIYTAQARGGEDGPVEGAVFRSAL